ncbi:tripartite tricarboxylate transporter TctB family protein [Bacillus sp. JJ1562]|uniref:tripartite tricarboxylate transporter TctB family protein n=1 Tax=Bacillus sp. JJ1562 TaxID=3122960 RepID=UPI0030016749
MTASKKDYLFYSIVIAFAGFFLMSTTQIHSANKTTILGPKAWPSIILILMLVLAIMGIIKTFITSKKAAAAQLEKSKETEEPEKRIFNIPMSIISILSIILYSVGLYVFGFIISSILFLYLLTQVLGAKKQLVIILVSVILTVFFVWLFSIVLKVPLPRGIGIFREFSLLFY